MHVRRPTHALMCRICRLPDQVFSAIGCDWDTKECR